MRFTTVLALVGMAMGKPQPQLPTPGSPPPPLTSHQPTQTTSSTPNEQTSPPPVPLPPTTSSKGAPPAPTNGPEPEGPICECGYTYCASVLMAMKKPWSQKELSEAYCSTPHAACINSAPSTNITAALYLCLCDDIDQKVGNDLHLICGCDNCLNVGPDFRGRCETPCHAGTCSD